MSCIILICYLYPLYCVSQKQLCLLLFNNDFKSLAIRFSKLKTSIYLHEPLSNMYKYSTMSQKIEKISFRIIGMYCITCKPIVQKQLKDEKAVQRIDINYMTDSVIIEFDSSLITREQIRNRLEKSGYKFVRTAAS